jgi:hypothetical protein
MLAGGVRAGGVDEINAPFERVAHGLNRVGFAHPLDGYAAEAETADV